MAQTRKNDDT